MARGPEGCFWASETRERQPGSGSGPPPRPGAFGADLRGDERRGIPPPRLPLPVTHRCQGNPHESTSWLFDVCHDYFKHFPLLQLLIKLKEASVAHALRNYAQTQFISFILKKECK